MREIKTPDFDINVVWQNIGTMKIKHGSNPIGTKHLVIHYGTAPTYLTYAVRHVTEMEPNIPTGEPLVVLAFAGGRAESLNNPTPYITLPLSVFVKEVKPVTDADKFWTDKGNKIESE